MRRKAVFLFITGMLCGALLLGGAVFAFQATSGGAQAQASPNWQVTKSYMVALWGKGGADDPTTWLKKQPTSCDIQEVPYESFVSFYYRCSK